MKVIQNYRLTLNFVKKKSIDIFKKKILIYKAKQFMMNFFFKKSLHILEDSASGMQIGDFEQVNV